MQSLENATSTPLWFHIDRLNPMEEGVTPVGPFIGDKHTANYCIFGCCNQIKTILWLFNKPAHPAPHGALIKLKAFRLQRHRNIERGNRIYIVKRGCTN